MMAPKPARGSEKEAQQKRKLQQQEDERKKVKDDAHQADQGGRDAAAAAEAAASGVRNMLVDELPAVLTAANNDTVQEQEMEVRWKAAQ